MNKPTHKNTPQEIKTPKHQLTAGFPTYRWYRKYFLYVAVAVGKRSILHWVYFCIVKNHTNSLVIQWLLMRTSLLLQNKQTLFKVESWIITTSPLETLQHPLPHLQVFGSGRFWKSTAQKSSLTTGGGGSIFPKVQLCHCMATMWCITVLWHVHINFHFFICILYTTLELHIN